MHFYCCFSGDFPCPVFDIVLKRITIRGSIVGTRKDMEEAIGFASRGNNVLSAILMLRVVLLMVCKIAVLRY